jgi:hypothetical protein
VRRSDQARAFLWRPRRVSEQGLVATLWGTQTLVRELYGNSSGAVYRYSVTNGE